MESEARVDANLQKTLHNLIKALGKSGKAHRSFLNMLVEDGMTESTSKSTPAKKIANTANANQMLETERSAQVQACGSRALSVKLYACLFWSQVC